MSEGVSVPVSAEIRGARWLKAVCRLSRHLPLSHWLVERAARRMRVDVLVAGKRVERLRPQTRWEGREFQMRFAPDAEWTIATTESA